MKEQRGIERGRDVLFSLSSHLPVSCQCLSLLAAQKPASQGAWLIQSPEISLLEHRAGQRKVESACRRAGSGTEE